MPADLLPEREERFGSFFAKKKARDSVSSE